MKEFAGTYKQLFTSKKYLWAFTTGMVLFIGSLFVNFYAGLYATERASNSVTDIILSNIPVYNVDDIFIYGTGLLFLFILFLCLYRPQRFPFMSKSVGLFILIRSVFISLTHIGQFPTHTIINPLSIINFFSSGSDLFFSGHTGIPFLVALIFWEKPLLRYTFLAISLFFAVVVLLGHLHYSIDVLSAFFITYSIYHITLVWFKKDREIFMRGVETIQ